MPTHALPGLTAALGSVQRCQTVAACRDDQRARESSADGRANGELTRALTQELMSIEPALLGELRWGHIWRSVERRVRHANPRQSPWFSGGFGRRVFGFGHDEDGDRGYAIVQVPRGYQLDVGSLDGVTEGALIAVYGPTPSSFPTLGTPEDRDARFGHLRVVTADRSRSEAVADTAFHLPAGARGRLVTAGRAARLRVALQPNNDTLASALKSELIELVQEAPDVTLVRVRDGWALTDDVHGDGTAEDCGDGTIVERPVLAVIPSASLDVARGVVEHYHAYATPLRFARGCHDLPNALEISLLDCNGVVISAEAAQDPDLPRLRGGPGASYVVSVGDKLCIAVSNRSRFQLSVTLIDCAASGKVLLLGEKPIRPESRHVFWYGESLGHPFDVSLPRGATLGFDRLVAIGTTRPDLSLARLARHAGFADMLAVRRGHSEKGSASAPLQSPTEEWTATTVGLRIEAAG